MALQDLTPQLRTRLSRMERAVGWFLTLAILLLTVGFVYYVYQTAARKGWFKTKALFFTFADRATGLKVGDPVQLIGLEVGQITRMEPMDPYSSYNIYVEFQVQEPYYGYLWTKGSRVKINTADFLGKRVLELTKGTGGYPAYVFHPLREVSVAEAQGLVETPQWELAQEVFDASGTNLVASPFKPLTNLAAITATGCQTLMLLNTNETRKSMTGIWNDKEARYDPFTRDSKPYWLVSDESVAVTERLENLVSEVEHALPNVLNLTNKLAEVLSNTSDLTSNLNLVALTARPAVSNLATVTSQLDRPGALGEWLLPTNLNRQLQTTMGNADAALASAHGTLDSANTNLTILALNLNRSLDNLAGITSNLNRQVEINTNLLTTISETITHADQFVQGLKHHWLLRSAFKTKATNAPPATPQAPLVSPKDKAEQH